MMGKSLMVFTYLFATAIVSYGQSAPTLTTISPNSGVSYQALNQNNSAFVSISGTDFTFGLTIDAGPGITVSNVTVTGTSSITANLLITPAAALGARNITVTTSNGTSNPLTFTILPTPPQVASVSPNYAYLQSSVDITITGVRFYLPVTVTGSSGVTVSNINLIDSTTVTATVTVAANASTGSRSIILGTPSGTSFGSFQILALPPTLSGISPNFGGASSPHTTTTLTGTHFANGMTINVDEGIQFSSLQVINDTTAIANSPSIALAVTPGLHNVSVSTSAGPSNTVGFIVRPYPTLTGLAPNHALPGTSATITLTGTNFEYGMSFTPGAGISVSSLTVLNSTTATATVDLAPNASPGARTFSVLTTGGTSAGTTNPVTFTIDAITTLSGINPASGNPGSTFPVTLIGTNFSAPLTINAPNGIAVSNVVVTNSTTATATFTLASAPNNNALGTRNITVTDAGGVSNAATFTVNPPPPTLTSFGFPFGPTNQGSGGTRTLNGSNFASGMTVNGGPGITVSNVNVTNSFTATMFLSISLSAPLGNHDVTVTTAGGTSNAINFAVSSPITSLSAVSPSSGLAGTSVNVTLTGNRLDSSVTISSSGITVSNLQIVSATSATATFTIPANASLGAHSIAITSTTSGTGLGNVSFTVKPAPPTLTSLTPTSGFQGGGAQMIFTGTNFVSGMTADAGPGIAFDPVGMDSSTLADVVLVTSSTASIGVHNVTLTSLGGTSNALPFVVTAPPAPTLTSLGATSGNWGTSVFVTLSGKNFIAGMTINGGPGITFSPLTVETSGNGWVTFTILSGAPAGVHNVTITSPSGTSNALSFTVGTALPSITKLSPDYSASNAAVNVVLTGARFIPGMTIDPGPGISVGNIVVNSETTASATFAVSAAAAGGPRFVTATTTGGISNASPFFVGTPPSAVPVLFGVAPNFGARNSSVPVTLNGINFSGPLSIEPVSGITISNFSVVDSTSATALFSISPSASPGSSSVTVTNSSGTSNSVAFFIDTPPPPPALSSMTPASSIQGRVVGITVNGTSFLAPMSCSISGTGIAVGAASIVSATKATTTLSLEPDAPTGPRTFTCSNSGQTGNTLTFTVDSAVRITVSKTGFGGGSISSSPAGIDCGVSCDAPSPFGQVITLTATPSPGSVFGGWSGDADCLDGSVTMTATQNCVARFDLPQQDTTLLRGDFDGDGKTDIAVYRPSSGEWYLRLSTQNYAVAVGNWYFQWGVPGDVPIAGDFDGDGNADISVYRPSSGEWFLRLSTQNYVIAAGNWYFQWGVPGDVPVTGDFDHDRITDIAVYRPATGEWFLRLSTQNYVIAAGNWYFQWGVPGDVPTAGDFDADGKTDIAVYRPSTGEWYIRLSSENYSIAAGNWYFQWGVPGDVPIAGDFDADGKTDIAVYRPSSGEWFMRLSAQNYVTGAGNWYFQWGQPGDLSVRGDFDGDLKTDIAVYRPSTGEWYLRLSTQNYSIATGNWFFQWGQPGDLSLRR